MKVYTYSHARQNLSQVLNRAKVEKVLIRRRGGDVFVVEAKKSKRSPLDVAGVKTRATMDDILEAVRETRARDNPKSSN